MLLIVMCWQVEVGAFTRPTSCSGVHLYTHGQTLASLSNLMSVLYMAGTEDGEGNDKSLIEVDEDGIVYRKGGKQGLPIQKRDNRDSMPYKTYIMMDGKARNAELIATLRLDALTACGDLIDLGDKGIFEVIRVSFVYKWAVGGFVVTGKRLYCKDAKKKWAQSVEKSLQ